MGCLHSRRNRVGVIPYESTENWGQSLTHFPLRDPEYERDEYSNTRIWMYLVDRENGDEGTQMLLNRYLEDGDTAEFPDFGQADEDGYDGDVEDNIDDDDKTKGEQSIVPF